MREPPQHLPHFLRQWRLFRGLTLEQVANILGVRDNTLSDKELGKRPVTTEELAKLAEIYGCEPWMLLAAPPESELIAQLKRAKEILGKLTPKQVDSWLTIGDTIATPEK